MTDRQYAEDIAEGPDPDTDEGPAETDDEIAEAQRLIDQTAAGAAHPDPVVRAQHDWNLQGDN